MNGFAISRGKELMTCRPVWCQRFRLAAACRFCGPYIRQRPTLFRQTLFGQTIG